MSSPASYTNLLPGVAAPTPPCVQGLHDSGNDRRPQRDLVKTSKNRAFTLRLLGDYENASLSQPEYSSDGAIVGIVEVAKPGGVSSVEVKVNPTLLLLRFPTSRD